MRSYSYRVAGEQTVTFVPESSDDLEEFAAWVRREHGRVIGVDTEGTGLDTYAAGNRLRTVQFGTGTEAWVVRVEHRPQFEAAARNALLGLPRIALHNAPFDWLVLDRHLRVPMEVLAHKTVDTRILAHLLDPRGPEDGGIGHGLKSLSQHHIDPDAPDTQEGLISVFRQLGHTKATGWAAIPSDHPTYLRYAGLDVIFTSRLLDVLGPLVHERSLERLADFEHQVARVCATMERRGVLIDKPYVDELSSRLATEAEHHRNRAKRYGVSTIGSTRQVADALVAMGEVLTDTTASGALQVDKDVLLPLADLDPQWERLGVREPNPLADAVVRAKRASKWLTTYADAMAAGLDERSRLHPKINSLQARTARMSISKPPLQQLPGGDSTIRKAMVAKPGNIIGSVDYTAIEMRVLAALAGDRAMVTAIRDGADLHDFTAEQIYGPDFTKRHRKVAKTTGFAKVYGGGVESIARQTGVPEADVRRAIAAYDRTFPGIKRYSARLTARGKYGAKELISPTGRILPLDRSRLYAATNYMVQSLARDVFAQGLLGLDKEGLTAYLRLPVHDEVIFEVDEDDAFEIAETIQATLAVADFFGVPLDTEAELFGPAWEPSATRYVRTGDGSWTRTSPVSDAA
ncbi:DNA polymerase [Saccharopolyspora aridisoli]|uniref:DNA polymerase I n=1 Tax=Saccharopolyspora aridisoli TaxID=2530385 RepID=A0A4R4UK37_9PSEU|nr:DNA polymerase [Saccharopolyspora aridisoli]TDC92338.1 DNA polymerase [Saccharopolyspora aridisoli]